MEEKALDISPYRVIYGWLDENANSVMQVLNYRMILGISNLLDIPKIRYIAAYRLQGNTEVDPYVLFAWQRMCELLTQNSKTTGAIDVQKLYAKIPDIKKAMFMPADHIQTKLSEIFSECGIAFRIVPNFIGAPVQGFIKKAENGGFILCMTLRQKFADIFWFTLFHEIAHILNGDTKCEFTDSDSVSGKMETKANRLAGELLIDPDQYQIFIDSKQYQEFNGIERFAASQNIQPYIVRGRLMKEQIIPWKARPRYEWA